jgi:hypothetical protein
MSAEFFMNIDNNFGNIFAKKINLLLLIDVFLLQLMYMLLKKM